MLVWVQSSYGQTKQEKIAQIKQIFNDINKTPGLEMVTLKEDEFLEQTPDGGGSLTGFFTKESLVKIKQWIGLSYGTLEIEFYFNNADLVFSYVREKHFQLTDSGINHNKITTAFEGRYYFENGKIIDTKKKGEGFWVEDNSNADSLPADAARYSRLLNEKKAKH